MRRSGRIFMHIGRGHSEASNMAYRARELKLCTYFVGLQVPFRTDTMVHCWS